MRPSLGATGRRKAPGPRELLAAVWSTTKTGPFDVVLGQGSQTATNSQVRALLHVISCAIALTDGLHRIRGFVRAQACEMARERTGRVLRCLQIVDIDRKRRSIEASDTTIALEERTDAPPWEAMGGHGRLGASSGPKRPCSRHHLAELR